MRRVLLLLVVAAVIAAGVYYFRYYRQPVPSGLSVKPVKFSSRPVYRGPEILKYLPVRGFEDAELVFLGRTTNLPLKEMKGVKEFAMVSNEEGLEAVAELELPPQEVIDLASKHTQVTGGTCGGTLRCWQVAVGKERNRFVYVSFRDGMAFVHSDPDALVELASAKPSVENGIYWLKRLGKLPDKWLWVFSMDLDVADQTGKKVKGFVPSGAGEVVGRIKKVSVKGFSVERTDGFEGKVSVFLTMKDGRVISPEDLRNVSFRGSPVFLKDAIIAAVLDLRTLTEQLYMALGKKSPGMKGSVFLSVAFPTRPVVHVMVINPDEELLHLLGNPREEWQELKAKIPPVVSLIFGRFMVRRISYNGAPAVEITSNTEAVLLPAVKLGITPAPFLLRVDVQDLLGKVASLVKVKREALSRVKRLEIRANSALELVFKVEVEAKGSKKSPGLSPGDNFGSVYPFKEPQLKRQTFQFFTI